MKIPMLREQITADITNLIKHLSGLDKPTFDKRAAKFIQPFFLDHKVTWIPAPVVVSKEPLRLREALRICDSQGRAVAFVLLSNLSTNNVKKNVEAPPEWTLIEKIISGLYQSAIKLFEANELSFLDDVTSLFNQRYLQLVLDKELKRADRFKTSFSMLFIDVDHFKNVNDTKGHLVGSKLLLQISDILKQNIRTVDYGFRYGGDEFILILVGTDKNSATAVGERIRKQVEKTVFIFDGHKVKLTLSIGVSSFPEHAKTKEDIIRLADEAMYEGKNKSRNVVNVAS